MTLALPSACVSLQFLFGDRLRKPDPQVLRCHFYTINLSVRKNEYVVVLLCGMFKVLQNEVVILNTYLIQ